MESVNEKRFDKIVKGVFITDCLQLEESIVAQLYQKQLLRLN